MNLSIVIPAAGLGKRMKSYGPKPLININGKSILQRQLEIISSVYPDNDIVVVGGFEYEKVSKYLNNLDMKNVKFIGNTRYSTTNVVRSIEIGTRVCDSKNVLIVYGDLVFNKETISNFELKESGLLLDTNNNFDKLEVGINMEENKVKNLSYSSENKWAHIAYLKENDIKEFNELVNTSYYERMFSFEIFNMMIENNKMLNVYKNESMFVCEVDDATDIDRVKKLAEEGKI